MGEIGISLWELIEEQDGMHLGARGFVHAGSSVSTGAAIAIDDGASGEPC